VIVTLVTSSSRPPPQTLRRFLRQVSTQIPSLQILLLPLHLSRRCRSFLSAAAAAIRPKQVATSLLSRIPYPSTPTSRPRNSGRSYVGRHTRGFGHLREPQCISSISSRFGYPALLFALPSAFSFPFCLFVYFPLTYVEWAVCCDSMRIGSWGQDYEGSRIYWSTCGYHVTVVPVPTRQWRRCLGFPLFFIILRCSQLSLGSRPSIHLDLLCPRRTLDL
jgi:hypothetical protein